MSMWELPVNDVDNVFGFNVLSCALVDSSFVKYKCEEFNLLFYPHELGMYWRVVLESKSGGYISGLNVAHSYCDFSSMQKTIDKLHLSFAEQAFRMLLEEKIHLDKEGN